jgi:hypothetical protein
MTSPSISPQRLSLAAANGLTTAVAQSWWPSMVRTPRVLVPIELDVLMVRDTTQAWANCKMQTPPKPSGPNSTTDAASLLPPPFTELQTPRETGAYLQWYLPNGLTSGTAGADAGSLNYPGFPAIPDRWLVLRISPGVTPLRRAVTGWVLEAGTEPPVVTDLANFSEPGPATGMQNPLTVLGHGDLTWAGYFDNVQNRLGYYDALTDRDQGPLAYLVCGWYSDPSNDPLGSPDITSVADFNAAMSTLGWQLDTGPLVQATVKRNAFLDVARQIGLNVGRPAVVPGFVAGQSWWPTATVFHGAVVGIDWPGTEDTVEVGGPPDPSAITVAVGDTMAETMAALIARANNAPDQAPIVEALQLGVLSEVDQPDGRALLDAQLHASSFISHVIDPPGSEPITIAPSGPPPAPPADPTPPGPGIFAEQEPSLPIGVFRGELPVSVVKTTAASPTSSASQTDAPHHDATAIGVEVFRAGGLQAVLAALDAGVSIPPTDPGGDIDAQRAAPRYYTPADPILLVQGGQRAFTHDSSVQTENGMVVCRLTPVSALSWTMPDNIDRFLINGDDILEQGVGNGSVPPECEELLRETAILDTGSADAIAATTAARIGGSFDTTTATTRIAVEQSAWYALRNPRIDSAPLLARSGISGTLPAPFSVAPPARPWTPVHLDWEVEYLPSVNGDDDWTLTDLDYTLNSDAPIPQPGSGVIFQGRATLTAGAANTVAAAVRKALDDVTRISGAGPVPTQGVEAYFCGLAESLSLHLRGLSLGAPAAVSSPPGDDSSVDPSLLNDIASALAQMDILSCGLDGLLTQLRGGIPADGQTGAPGGVTPTPFFALRTGFLHLKRLRLVDGFGQFVDLCGSDETQDAQGYLVSDPMSVPNQLTLLAQPPRFTAPTRGWFRYMSATQPGVEADSQNSPVCGFVMPNHLDGSLEFFNADGSGAGSLQTDDQDMVTWQAAPGLPSTAGQDPAATVTNGYLAQLAGSLLDWAVADAGQSHEAALAALLRTIDSTLWAVDPFGHQGDEHLALLLGHPVCVMRGLLRLDVADPVVTADKTLAKVPIRLGDFTQWQDGLLGYFVNDDYTTLYVADASAAGMARQIGPQQGFLQQINLVPDYYSTFADDIAGNATSDTVTTGTTPVTHPYVNIKNSGLLWMTPNQTINLTLLVEPLTSVYATMGRVPRKDIGMRRGWVNDGLAAIAPTFRFGPVLVDPKQIRMPLATDIAGSWVWDYRADAVTWDQDPVVNATDGALLGADPPTGSEGWLKLLPPQQGSAT